MRVIGYLDREDIATRFSDFLFSQGIKNQVESETNGAWAIWVHDEELLDRGRQFLDEFRLNPEQSKYTQAAGAARRTLEEEAELDAKARERFFDRRKLFPRHGRYGIGPLTFALMAICVVVAVRTKLGEPSAELANLFISQFRSGLPEVRHGEVWRLITPIFVHFGILHIVFNMMWLFHLGSMIEGRLGSGMLALQVLIIGIIANLAQYVVAGPGFGGMSGVVYGLLGYIWMRGRHDPGCGLYLSPQDWTMALVWFAAGFMGFLPIANTNHAAGLITGLLWGYAAAKSGRLLRR
jgi:GlpG protein